MQAEQCFRGLASHLIVQLVALARLEATDSGARDVGRLILSRDAPVVGVSLTVWHARTPSDPDGRRPPIAHRRLSYYDWPHTFLGTACAIAFRSRRYSTA